MSQILLIHRGGLGDFLMAWPSLLSIREHRCAERVFWGGPSSRMLWLRPLGMEPCPQAMRRGVEALFGREDWPEELEGVQIYWFVLGSRPPVPEHPQLKVLYGLPCPDTVTMVSPREAYAGQLRSLGINDNPAWLEIWRGHFGVPEKRRGAEYGEVLLLPGAGHPAKQWPLVQFFELAAWLQRQGHKVRFILGPAERERGMTVQDFPTVFPDSLDMLQDVLQGARLVVGNDSGPMHLAGMLGVPGLALFGPASEAQWRPQGLQTIALDLICRPCTQTGRIHCPDARCLREIPQAMVREIASKLLAACFCKGDRGA